MQIVININGKTTKRIVLGGMILFALVAIAIPVMVGAKSVSLPHRFQNGDVADADQVNANFDALAAGINDQESITSTLVTTGAANEQSTVALKTALDDLKEKLGINKFENGIPPVTLADLPELLARISILETKASQVDTLSTQLQDFQGQLLLLQTKAAGIDNLSQSIAELQVRLPGMEESIGSFREGNILSVLNSIVNFTFDGDKSVSCENNKFKLNLTEINEHPKVGLVVSGGSINGEEIKFATKRNGAMEIRITKFDDVIGRQLKCCIPALPSPIEFDVEFIITINGRVAELISTTCKGKECHQPFLEEFSYLYWISDVPPGDHSIVLYGKIISDSPFWYGLNCEQADYVEKNVRVNMQSLSIEHLPY